MFNRMSFILCFGLFLIAQSAQARISSQCGWGRGCRVCIDFSCKTVYPDSGSATISNTTGRVTVNGIPWDQIRSGDRVPTYRPPQNTANSSTHSKKKQLRGCRGELGSRHANGGGFVAQTASVGSAVYVGPEASVCDKASISGAARVTGKSVVYGNASISGVVKVDNSNVGGDVSLSGAAEVHGMQLTSGSYSGVTILAPSRQNGSKRRARR